MVSVIIPVYNAAPFVRKAVESAISLDEVSEVLLIEDNSPDDSLAVCQALAREYNKVKLLRHPDGGNHGAGASRNLGIRHARCDYIAFLDADDWYLPNRFKTSLPILESQPDVDGVFEAGGVEFISWDLREQWIKAAKPLINPELQDWTPRDLLVALWRGLSLQTNCFTLRRCIFQKTGPFDEQLLLSEDTAMWWKMALVGVVVPGSLARPVAVRLVHPCNRSTEKNRDLIKRAHKQLWEILWHWCKKLPIPFSKRKLILQRLISSELRERLCYSKTLRPIESAVRFTQLLSVKQRNWRLIPGEILYAYYHVSGMNGLTRRLARIVGKDK
jgi:glycosyltransferase involved in cell wall biosynthesis